MTTKARHITIFLSVTALLAFLLSFIAPVSQNLDSRQVARVERHLLKKQKLMEKYVRQVQDMPVDEWIQLPGFPEDMVLYRYNADTLQSWVNEFSISNDEVDVPPLWYRLHFMSNNNLYNTPLAYITDKDSYVNLGLSWYVVKAYTSGTTKIITGIRVKDEYPSDNMEIVSKMNPSLGMGKGYTSSTLDMNNGVFVRGADGDPLFSIVPASASSTAYRDYTLRFVALLLILLAVFYYHFSERSRISLIVSIAVPTVVMAYALFLFGKVDTGTRIFSPQLYADARWFDSFARMLATHLYLILVITSVFLIRKTIYRKVLEMKPKDRHLVGAFLAVLTVLFALYIHFSLRSLIRNSSIVLDLYRITELSVYSILAYLSYALLFLTLPEKGGVPDEKILRFFLSSENPENFFQVLDGIGPDRPEIGRLQGGFLRKDASFHPRPFRQFRHWKGSGDIPDASVETQFPHDEVIPQQGKVPLPGGGDDSECDREVVSAAALVHVGRGQIDDDFPARNPESPGLESRNGPQEALLDGGVRQADQMDPDAGRDIDFNGYRDGIDADAFRPVDIDEHTVFSET